MSLKKSLCALPVAMAALLHGQDGPITRVTVNQVRIDAVVTDAKGKLVHNLQTNDFEVLQDGKRVKPIHVEYVAGSGAEATASAREAQSNDVKRTFVVVIDDAQMSFENFTHTRLAVRQYLDRSMQPGDRVAVLRTMQSSSYSNPFQSDPAAVRHTVDQMHYAPPLSSHGSYRSVFSLLQSVLSAMRRMPGRKSLILFSDGMPVSNAFSPQPLQLFQQLADSALRSSVRIYGIDARGLTTQKSGRVSADVMDTGVSPAKTQNSSQSQRGQAAKEQKNAAAEASLHQQINDALSPVDVNFPPRPSSPLLGPGAFPQENHTPRMGDMDGLAFLATETGGLMLQDNNDLGGELRKALGNESGYYLIAWDPGERAFKPTQGTFADFHNITVKLARAGLKARTPHGFYGYDRGVESNSGRAPQIAMQEALLSPFQTGGFDAQMNSTFDVEAGRGYIRSFVYIAGKDIVFHPYTDARRNDCYALHLEFLTLPQQIDGSVDTVDTLAESQTSSLEMCGTYYDAIAHHGLAVTMLHPVDQPGAYQMRIAVRNAGGVSVGSAHQLVDVPEWSTAPSLFGLSVHSDQVDAPVVRPRLPGETDKNMMLAYRPALPGDPSLRQFNPGEKLQYQAQIAHVDNATAQLRILRDDGEVSASESATVHDGIVSGTYTLDSTLPPGSYDLQLIVSGEAPASQPYRTTADLNFEVRP